MKSKKSTIFISVLLFMATCYVGAWNNGEKLSELLSKADALEEQKDYDNALEVYREALKVASNEGLSSDASFIYKKIGLIYYRQEDFKNSKKSFRNSISKGPTSKDAADSYFNLSLIYRKEKKQDSLLWALDNALKVYDNLEDGKDKFSTYSKAGILYKQSGEYDRAIKYLLLAYDGFSKNGDVSQKATVCGNIADIQRHLGNLDIAEEYYRQHLKLRTKLTDTLKLSFAHNNMANLFYETKRYDSAIVHYNRALILQRHLNDRKNIGKTLGNIGMVHYQMNDLDNALAKYSEALEIKKQAKDSSSMVQTLNELATISLDKMEYGQAKDYLKQSGKYISEVTEKPTLLRHYSIYSRFFELTGNYKKAYEYQDLQFSLYREVFNEEQSRAIQTLQEQFQSQLKEERISQLNLMNEQNESTIQIQEQQLRNTYLSLALLGIAILFLIGVFFYIRQRQKNKIQQLENRKLEAVLQGQETIKEHISKDLHDIIATSYDAIRLKILALPKAKDPERLIKDVIDNIKSVNHQIRLISHRLSPLGNRIKDLTLSEIIIAQLSEFQHYGKIFVDIQLPLPEALDRMTLEAQTNFYGILLEILNNIENHAKATEVSIEHTIIDDRELQFKICDNGIGLVKNSNNGIGLANIRQRTALLGGRYTMESSEKGTCIDIMFPINKNLK